MDTAFWWRRANLFLPIEIELEYVIFIFLFVFIFVFSVHPAARAAGLHQMSPT
jgi:ABC-type lipoprotein release transport system permease subunit